MTAEQKQRALTALGMWHSSNDSSQREYQAAELMAALLQELVGAPEALASTNPSQISSSAEPFGYFKAEPFGWTDCAETDDGAIALYTAPPAPIAPEAEPVARVTGYYAGYLTIATIDGRVLPAGTALYLAPPAQSVPDGWRIVPYTPTVQMLERAAYAVNNRPQPSKYEPSATPAIIFWTAMLNYAPEAVFINSCSKPPKLSDERILDAYAEVSGRPVTMGKNRIIDFARAVEREILGGGE